MECNPIPKDLESEALSAEALSSLNESAPRLVRAVAEGLGITHGGLRLMAEQGALTSEVLIVAFQKKAQDLQQEDRDRMAEIDAKALAHGFSHVDVLRALDAAAAPKFFVGGLYPGDIPVSKAVAAAARTLAAGDMLAKEHPGEAIVPATFNPWPEMLAASREIVRLNTQIARLLDRWDGDGLPGTSAANEASDAAERAAESTRRASRSAHRS